MPSSHSPSSLPTCPLSFRLPLTPVFLLLSCTGYVQTARYIAVHGSIFLSRPLSTRRRRCYERTPRVIFPMKCYATSFLAFLMQPLPDAAANRALEGLRSEKLDATVIYTTSHLSFTVTLGSIPGLFGRLRVKEVVKHGTRNFLKTLDRCAWDFCWINNTCFLLSEKVSRLIKGFYIELFEIFHWISFES